MEKLTNRELKNLLDANKVSYDEIRPILNKRIKVFTRTTAGNSIIRVDLVSKQNENDISLFKVLNGIYAHNELKTITLYLPEEIRWFKVD